MSFMACMLEVPYTVLACWVGNAVHCRHPQECKQSVSTHSKRMYSYHGRPLGLQHEMLRCHMHARIMEAWTGRVSLPIQYCVLLQALVGGLIVGQCIPHALCKLLIAL